MRFPFAPLEPLIEAKWRPRDENDVAHAGVTAKAAHVLDLPKPRVQRWRRNGLNERNADLVAGMLGYHPGHIWPEWWDIELEDAA